MIVERGQSVHGSNRSVYCQPRSQAVSKGERCKLVEGTCDLKDGEYAGFDFSLLNGLCADVHSCSDPLRMLSQRPPACLGGAGKPLPGDALPAAIVWGARIDVMNPFESPM